MAEQEIIPHGAAIGRPTAYSQERGDAICERLSLGESLREICDGDEAMPARSSVYRWLLDPERAAFRDQYARARELQADSYADETKEIADDGTNDWMEKHDKDGNLIGWMVNGEAVARSKLRLDQRKWHASKLAPKKYGEKLDLTTDGDKITADVNDAAARAAALLATARDRMAADKSKP